MTGSSDLRDRLFREMLASDRSWSPDEIARGALRIVSDASRVDGLVAAVLAGDPRFRREGGRWRAHRRPAPRLDSLSFLLCDAPPAPRSADTGPLCLLPYEAGRAGAAEPVLVTPDGSGLERAGSWCEQRLAVSLTAATARRRLYRLERLHAFPAISERLLDLNACLRLLGKRMQAALARESDATIDERLHACRAALERVLDTFGSGSLEDLEASIDHAVQAQPVDFSAYRFDRGDLDAVPSRPGLYRFLGAEERLLYVGKSRDLRRRVASYFRPLAPDHQRRAALLAEIRELSWETVPSELEALLLEAEAIQRFRPAYNQQIDVHPSGELPAPRDRDLAFVLCEGDPEEVSVFFLRDGEPWSRGRMPRDPAGAARHARRYADAWAIGRAEETSGLALLDAGARCLVLRFLRTRGDGVDRIRREAFPDAAGLASALADLAVRPRPAWEPWSLQAGARRA